MLTKTVFTRRLFGQTILGGVLSTSGLIVATSAHASKNMFSKHWPLRADVDLRTQRLELWEYGKKIYTWKISSGKKGYYTPQGVYSAKWMRKMHYSNTYDNPCICVCVR